MFTVSTNISGTVYTIVYSLCSYIFCFLSHIPLSFHLPIYHTSLFNKPLGFSFFPSIFLSFFLSFFPSNYLSIHLSFFPSMYLSIYLFFYLSIFLSIYLSFYLSIYLSFYLAIYLSSHLTFFSYIYTTHLYLSYHLSILPIYLSFFPSMYTFNLFISLITCSCFPSIYLSSHISFYQKEFVFIHDN